MDDTVSQAVYAVHLDEVSVEPWFELICRTYASVVEADQLDWSHFVSVLTEGAKSASINGVLVEQFVEHMTANDLAPLETVGHMAERPIELPLHYRERPMSTETAGDLSAAAYDESAWQNFLVAHGSHWGGTVSSWDQFRVWFLYEADQHGLTFPANEFIRYAESQQDKAAVFALYQVPLAGAHTQSGEQRTQVDASTFPETKHGDSGEWIEYLKTMLTHHGF